VLFILIRFQRAFLFQNRLPIFCTLEAKEFASAHFAMTTADGETLDAVWLIACGPPCAALLYLHGNATNLNHPNPFRSEGFFAMADTFIDPASRFRLHFDETGTGDLKAHQKDENQRYLSLTGLVFRQDTHDTRFTARVSAFKREIFGTPDVFLHRRDIINRTGIFAVLDDQALRAI
jgi:hypothetical protein